MVCDSGELWRQTLNPNSYVRAVLRGPGSYNAALDLSHTALRAESEGERYTGVLRRLALTFALRVYWLRSRGASPALLHAAWAMCTMTALQTCLRRASARAPGARCVGPLPPLHRTHRSWGDIKHFRHGHARIGGKLFECLKHKLHQV